MEIIDKRKKSVSFETVKCGEIFEVDECLFMKTDSSYCDDNGDYDNAVNLEVGGLSYFEYDDLVLPVNCKLVLE